MALSYRQKLLDPRWQKKRLEMLNAAAWQCEKCQATDRTLHVHHRRYVSGREPWEYEAADLGVLCDSCHEKETFGRFFHEHAETFNRLCRFIATCPNPITLTFFLTSHYPSPVWTDEQLQSYMDLFFTITDPGAMFDFLHEWTMTEGRPPSIQVLTDVINKSTHAVG